MDLSMPNLEFLQDISHLLIHQYLLYFTFQESLTLQLALQIEDTCKLPLLFRLTPVLCPLVSHTASKGLQILAPVKMSRLIGHLSYSLSCRKGLSQNRLAQDSVSNISATLCFVAILGYVEVVCSQVYILLSFSYFVQNECRL